VDQVLPLTYGAHVQDPDLRAALFSAAFTHWRRRYAAVPLLLPPGVRDLFAKSDAEIRALVATNPKDLAAETLERKYARRSVEHLLDTQHFKASPGGKALLSANALLLTANTPQNPSGTDLQMTFDLDTWITSVSVLSVFENVRADQAQNILLAAKPPSWKTAVPTFFERSDPGVWDVGSAQFQPLPVVGLNYQLLEQVEWNWSSLVSGGIINVLDIAEETEAQSGNALKNGGALSLELQARVQSATQLSPVMKQEALSRLSQATAPDRSLHFTYGLYRCLQSKFFLEWEPGGLDVDGGSYTALWSQTPGDTTGTLLLQAVKTLRYSAEHEEIAGLSAMLNFLAPSTTGMLMHHLGFSGIGQYLAQS
jgi:hypothetical protein